MRQIWTGLVEKQADGGASGGGGWGPTSFSITATRRGPFCRKMWLSRVVLPAPRKPVTCGGELEGVHAEHTHAVTHEKRRGPAPLRAARPSPASRGSCPSRA